MPPSVVIGGTPGEVERRVLCERVREIRSARHGGPLLAGKGPWIEPRLDLPGGVEPRGPPEAGCPRSSGRQHRRHHVAAFGGLHRTCKPTSHSRRHQERRETGHRIPRRLTAKTHPGATAPASFRRSCWPAGEARTAPASPGHEHTIRVDWFGRDVHATGSIMLPPANEGLHDPGIRRDHGPRGRSPPSATKDLDASQRQGAASTALKPRRCNPLRREQNVFPPICVITVLLR